MNNLDNTCCFCNQSLVNKETGWNRGHNPEPFFWNDKPNARCCDKCNQFVVFTRLDQSKSGCYKRFDWTNAFQKIELP